MNQSSNSPAGADNPGAAVGPVSPNGSESATRRDPGRSSETATLDGIVRALRKENLRITSTRRALLSALIRSSRHMSASDLAATVQEAQPDVHLSTIYRSLETLEQAGVIDHVHLGHGRAVYHLVQELHQHLLCDSCSTVIEVPDEDLEDLAVALHAKYGFVLRPHHFAVLGRCRTCYEAEIWSRPPM